LGEILHLTQKLRVGRILFDEREKLFILLTLGAVLQRKQTVLFSLFVVKDV